MSLWLFWLLGVVGSVGGTVELVQQSGQAQLDTVAEIRGVGAGAFNVSLWLANTLNWVPDANYPFKPPRRSGSWHNTYAPNAVPLPGGDWELYYGGWDGVTTPHDRVYSVRTDMMDFDEHQRVIDHGAFNHVNNVNVQRTPDGALHMMTTSFPDEHGKNKPGYYFSPDGGSTWNGHPPPYQAQLSDLVTVSNLPGYDMGDFNGANVLLQPNTDNPDWRLYLVGSPTNGSVIWASGSTPKSMMYRGIALPEAHLAVNDIKVLVEGGGKRYYLMGLHHNGAEVSYSISSDGGVTFRPSKLLFSHRSTLDRYMVAVGFVVVNNGTVVQGVLYGAGRNSALDVNSLYAMWLQKRVVLTCDGVVVEVEAAGPDRVWLKVPVEGGCSHPSDTIRVMQEDGKTVLGSLPAGMLKAGKVYDLVVRS